MASALGQEQYYTDLSEFSRSRGFNVTVGNPGTDTLESYVGSVSTLMIYESAGLPPLVSLQVRARERGVGDVVHDFFFFFFARKYFSCLVVFL